MNQIYERLSIAQIKILSLVAWSDGVITEEEKKFFNNMIEASPCSKETQIFLLKYINDKPDVDDVINSLKDIPKEVSVSALRNAYNIAMSDGKLNSAEIAVINLLAKELGVKEEHFDELQKFLHISYQIELLETKIFGTKF